MGVLRQEPHRQWNLARSRRRWTRGVRPEQSGGLLGILGALRPGHLLHHRAGTEPLGAFFLRLPDEEDLQDIKSAETYQQWCTGARHFSGRKNLDADAHGKPE